MLYKYLSRVLLSTTVGLLSTFFLSTSFSSWFCYKTFSICLDNCINITLTSIFKTFGNFLIGQRFCFEVIIPIFIIPKIDQMFFCFQGALFILVENQNFLKNLLHLMNKLSQNISSLIVLSASQHAFEASNLKIYFNISSSLI